MHSHHNASTLPELANWVKTLDESGIAKTIILSGITVARVDSLVDIYRKYPDKFELWCRFDYIGYDKPIFVLATDSIFQSGEPSVDETGLLRWKLGIVEGIDYSDKKGIGTCRQCFYVVFGAFSILSYLKSIFKF